VIDDPKRKRGETKKGIKNAKPTGGKRNAARGFVFQGWRFYAPRFDGKGLGTWTLKKSRSTLTSIRATCGAKISQRAHKGKWGSHQKEKKNWENRLLGAPLKEAARGKRRSGERIRLEEKVN